MDTTRRLLESDFVEKQNQRGSQGFWGDVWKMKSADDMVGEKSRVHGGGGICHIESELVLMSLLKTLWTAEISGLVPSVCMASGHRGLN